MTELAALGRALTERERRSIRRDLARALRTGADPVLPGTAFVSIYERGRLVGCIGHPSLHAALAMAREDPRFGGARGPADAQTIQVSFLACPAPLRAEEIAHLEVGTQGLLALEEGRLRTLLLPEVARDGMLGPAGMLAALARKLDVEVNALGELATIETERFVFRPEPTRGPGRRSTVELAARWLAARVGPSGEVAWGLDARAGRAHRTGAFHLGRAAVVIAALAAHGGHASKVTRARRWLAASLDAGLRGAPGVPREAAGRAGTVALASRAGLEVREVLEDLVDEDGAEIGETAWHAAQVVAVLGERAGVPVVEGALAPLVKGEWAPWSVLAADALGERALAARGRARLVASIAAEPPHEGGVSTGEVAEVALTALTAEVLAAAPRRDDAIDAALARARRFLSRQALDRLEVVPAALDARLALGAFPLAPHADFLRSDVTAHALHALLP